MATAIERTGPEIYGGIGRFEEIQITDLNVPASGTGESDLCRKIGTFGARRATIGLYNHHASLDLDLYVYATCVWAPDETHAAGQWDMKPYSGSQNYMDADHGAYDEVQLDGPFKWIKLRGVSSGAAFTEDADAYIVLGW